MSMMFSSNQVFEISGDLSQLEAAIDFAISYSGHRTSFKRLEKPSKCVYQITEDGRYCIGWNYGRIEEGWSEYPFDYDEKIISAIVQQWIIKEREPPNEYEGYSGGTSIGFLLQEGAGNSFEERNRVKNGFFSIVSIRPFWCFYAK